MEKKDVWKYYIWTWRICCTDTHIRFKRMGKTHTDSYVVLWMMLLLLARLASVSSIPLSSHRQFFVTDAVNHWKCRKDTKQIEQRNHISIESKWLVVVVVDVVDVAPSMMALVSQAKKKSMAHSIGVLIWWWCSLSPHTYYIYYIEHWANERISEWVSVWNDRWEKGLLLLCIYAPSTDATKLN